MEEPFVFAYLYGDHKAYELADKLASHMGAAPVVIKAKGIGGLRRRYRTFFETFQENTGWRPDLCDETMEGVERFAHANTAYIVISEVPLVENLVMRSFLRELLVRGIRAELMFTED